AVIAGPLAALLLARQGTAPKLRWHTPFAKDLIAAGGSVGTLFVVSDQIYLTGESGGQLRLRSGDGTVLFTYKPNGKDEKPIHVDVSSVDGAFCVGTNKNMVYCFASKGALRWSAEVPHESATICWPEFGPAGDVYVGLITDEGRSAIASFTAAGELRWNRGFPGTSGMLTVGQDGLVYVLSQKNTLSAISEDGDQLWRTAEDAVSLSEPLAAPDDGVFCWDMIDDSAPLRFHATFRKYSPQGKVLWKFNYANRGAGYNGLVDQAANLYFVGRPEGKRKSGLIALSADGSLRWHHPTT
ncbi:MAG: PQQ-like beta-propeller repeat protein, partial [bacterium]|nr:PQQ-like beta-propeller repeat protein [bacterium]